MDFSQIIIAPKLSKYEWDMQRYHLTSHQLILKYKREGVDVFRIMSSHRRQKESLREIQKLFKKSTFLSRNQLTRKSVAKAKLVISLGGDNHFQYVSHFVQDTPMIGVNSDPSRSEGALNCLSIDESQKLAKHLRSDRFKMNEWTRIQVVLNKKPLPILAVSEVYMGESLRRYMSRHRIIYKGKKEDQKCSGLVVSTGAGSTGWYDSACRFIFPKGNRFKKTEKYIRFLSSEPYDGKLSGHRYVEGKIQEGEVLGVLSLNDTGGILAVDSDKEYSFREGALAELSVGRPLKVISI
jgi:NAD+ kinase